MERSIFDYFQVEAMPTDCTERIEKSLTDTPPIPHRTTPLRRALTTAAIVALLSICALGVSAMTWGRDSNQLPNEHARQPLRNAYAMLFGLETRSAEERAADAAEDRSFERFQRRAHQTLDPIAETRDGRLYFVANGENIDITDQCSDDVVFLYTYTDTLGYIHYLGVGGTPERWGCSEVMFHPDYTHMPSGGWAGGSGCGHWDNKADEPYGWYIQFKELTGHPYPV